MTFCVATMFAAGGCLRAGGWRQGGDARGTGRRLGRRGVRLRRAEQSGQRHLAVITPTGIYNYEQTFKPIKASSVSKSPRAWNIRSTLTFDGESSDYRALYALDGGGRLTIVDEHGTETYSRCK